ncbi:hypothetical protein GGF32_009544 [Allomyces javanicus]|nr:hypothetical protein GGF32_009544 [Allomyces javanicus]
MAVAFMAARIDNSAYLAGDEEGVKFVPPFMAATVHFFTPDRILVAHTAEFALNNPDDGDIEFIVGNVVREYMPDPQALLCGVTAAASADNARAVRALQDKLRDLGPVADYKVAAQPCFAHVLHSIITVGVAALWSSGNWLRALVAATNGPIKDVWDRCWRAVYRRTDPKLAEDRFYPPTDEPGKWTWTRDMYRFVHKHRAVFLVVLRAANAEIQENARPTEEDWTAFTKVVQILELIDNALVHIRASSYPTLSRAALHLMTIYAKLKRRDCAMAWRMLAIIRAVWPVVMTRHVYQAVYLDAVSRGKVGFVECLGQYATEVEGLPCLPDAVQARWMAIRNGILDDMVRAEQLEDPGLENGLRADLNAELDTYETLVHEYPTGGRMWSPTATTVWWRDHGAQVPHVAHEARRVLCVPATMGTAMQRDVSDLEDVRLRWEEAMVREDQGDGAHTPLHGQFIVDLYLPFNVPASPSFRRLSAVLGPGFHPLKSVSAVALAVERVFAFRKSAFHEVLAAMDPRPPIAVSFMAPRINSRVDDFRGRWVGSLPPFVAVTVHFLTPDWNLVSHVAEFKTAAPGSTEMVEARDHREQGAVYLAVLADPEAVVPENAHPSEADWVVFDKAVAIFELLDDALKHASAPSYPTLARAAVTFINVFLALKQRETQSDLPVPIRDSVTRMLAKLRGAWKLVMTRHVYQGLLLDPASNGRVAMASFLDQYAAEVEGAPCPPDAFRARWKVTRDEILDNMMRTERPDPALVDVFRAKLNAELDTYETLVAWVPHVARAARVLCVPATTGTAMQPYWAGNTGKLTKETVVGRSLLETSEVMGIEKDVVSVVLLQMPEVPDDTGGNHGVPEQRDVIWLEVVRERWEESMSRQGDGTGWDVAM